MQVMCVPVADHVAPGAGHAKLDANHVSRTCSSSEPEHSIQKMQLKQSEVRIIDEAGAAHAQPDITHARCSCSSCNTWCKPCMQHVQLVQSQMQVVHAVAAPQATPGANHAGQHVGSYQVC